LLGTELLGGGCDRVVGGEVRGPPNGCKASWWALNPKRECFVEKEKKQMPTLRKGRMKGERGAKASR